MNGGTCYIDSTGNQACYCCNGYSGTLCQSSSGKRLAIKPWSESKQLTDINKTKQKKGSVCPFNPCLNGGTCYLDSSSQPACTCPNGFALPFCQPSITHLKQPTIRFNFTTNLLILKIKRLKYLHCERMP